MGAVTDSYSYDAFGNSIVSTGGSNNAYLFAGEQRDAETGLDYLRARYYDPFLGRFVSADAYEGTLGDSMSLHDYQYAHANPVVNTDPSGYFSIGEMHAAESIRNILAGIQWESGSYLIVATVKGGNYDTEDLLSDWGLSLGFSIVPPLLPFIARLSKLRPLARTFSRMRSGTGLPGEQIPPTGNPIFDILAKNTDVYVQWINNLQKRGIEIVESSMEIGTHAEISRIRNSTRLMIEIDPEQFTYLDLLHESRHFEQIRRIELQLGKPYNFNNADIAMFERGAYEYELRMAEKYKFTEEYKSFANERIRHYWDRGMRQKMDKSKSFRARYSNTWK